MVTRSPPSSGAGHDQRQTAGNRKTETHRERCPVRSHGCYGSAVLRGVCSHHINGSSKFVSLPESRAPDSCEGAVISQKCEGSEARPSEPAFGPPIVNFSCLIRFCLWEKSQRTLPEPALRNGRAVSCIIELVFAPCSRRFSKQGHFSKQGLGRPLRPFSHHRSDPSICAR